MNISDLKVGYYVQIYFPKDSYHEYRFSSYKVIAINEPLVTVCCLNKKQSQIKQINGVYENCLLFNSQDTEVVENVDYELFDVHITRIYNCYSDIKFEKLREGYYVWNKKELI